MRMTQTSFTDDAPTAVTEVSADFFFQVVTTQLAGGVQALTNVQTAVSGSVKNCIPDGPLPPETLATYAYALVREIGELTAEMNVSPWKDRKEPDRDRVLDELADVLAFTGLLMVYVQRELGVDAKDIARAYAAKSQVNMERVAGRVDGYRHNAGEK